MSSPRRVQRVELLGSKNFQQKMCQMRTGERYVNTLYLKGRLVSGSTFGSRLNPWSTKKHLVIDVGGKEFGFTWSRDELCDIYEERQSGEGGDGLLVECGSSWRKVNVLRTLDESTKKHVKKRSEEAERLLKSRKAIVLDPSNPSMKNQVKKMAAAGVEGSMRRMGWKQKKEVKEPFFKKQKVESNQVSNVCPPKSVYKSGAFSNRNAKGMLSVSPVPSPPEQPAPGSTVSPFATGTSSRGNAGLEEIVPLDINKEHVDIGNFEKELPSKIAHGAKHKVGKQKGCVGDQSVDLQSSHVRKASENSKGMALKALEKSSGEMVPNLATNNDSMVKNIEAPGKYLKSGVGAGSSKQREFESGSSPESAHDIASAIESIFGDNADEDFDRQAQPSSNTVEEDDPFEKIDIMNDNPDPFTNADKNIINDIEGKTSSSDSGSGSDSESDSSDSDSGSDSESQSRSRSKSRSPVGSASASSSDSDSDGSSTSKDVSDVDVDIMSEDEKQGLEPKAEAAYLKLSSSPRSRASDGEQEQIDILGVQEEQIASLPMDLNGRAVEMANPVEGAKNFPSSTSINTSENPEINDSRTIGSNLQRESSRFPGVALSPDRYKHSEDLHPQFVKLSSNINDEVIKKAVSEQQPKLDGFPAHAQTEIKKTKTKRDKPEYFKEKPESAKGSKGGRAAEGVPYGKSKHASLSVNSSYVSPEKTRQDQSKSNNIEWSGTKEADHQGHSLPDRGRSLAVGNMQKVHQGPEVWCSSGTGAEQPGPRSGDISERRKSMDRSNKTSERIPVRPDATLKDKTYKGTQDEVNIGEKLSILPEYNRKSVDHGGLNDSGPLLQIGKYDGNKSPLIGGKRSVLSRELSDLELGELREPSASGETGGVKRQTDGKKCFKSSESKAYSTDCPNPDISKGRSGSHLLPESMKHSPQSVRGEVHGNLEGFHRSMPSDDPAGTAPGPQRTILQGKHPSRVDHTDSEIKSHLDNPSELARRGETGANQGIGLENHADSLKRDPTSLPAQHSIKNGGQKGYKKAKELKQQKPSTLGHSAGQSNNGVSMENDSNSRKRRESSSEVDNSLYSKYDKEAPELRDSIKNFLQYKDYVQEYREKYTCYISLNKNLEKIRNDFLKVGVELEIAKGRGSEEYYKVVGDLKEMYHQHGERNKQMKRVFTVLHEELKTLKQRIQDFVEIHSRE
ncbi:uncharacterized protein A4U43_C03F18820 [Asparagus officinalis]|uniref:OCEL domain-containing protein n=1 Tax=Asparagus officinalis TaxID=4686 RepID=A0A5P1FC02_ASPOF|nr:uncharacterized protein A4U43_C03F18820 [Asparagus officinalis]